MFLVLALSHNIIYFNRRRKFKTILLIRVALGLFGFCVTILLSFKVSSLVAWFNNDDQVTGLKLVWGNFFIISLLLQMVMLARSGARPQHQQKYLM